MSLHSPVTHHYARRLTVKLVLFAFLLLPWIARAHIGSPNVFYEGKAGLYPVRVVVRPPEVVPGLAEISIRVEGNGVRKVTALPVFWNTGRKGSPPADEATPVRGETNLYATNLWLMESGAYSVDIEVAGDAGGGSVIVPVNSLALTRREMKPWFGAMLSALAIGLFIGIVCIAGAAFGEATLPPGAVPTDADRRRGRIAMVVGAVIFALLVGVGKKWWDRDDAHYRNNRLYKPQPFSAAVRREGSQNILRLEVQPSDNPRRGWTPLAPDHGKMMHLFLIREPTLDAFAHIHPVQRELNSPASGYGAKLPTFEVAVPPLPAGTYRIYADVTHENGLAQTLVASTQVPDPATPPGEPSSAATAGIYLAPDPDDSWHVDAPGSTPDAPVSTSQSVSCAVAGGGTMIWEKDAPLRENCEAPLRFKLLDKDGKPEALQPYMGMLGHSAIRREDGSVFAHLHPVGSISMASQEFFQRGGKDGAQSPAPEVHDHSQHMAAMKTTDTISFPYEFPKAGRYRIWVQVKSGDEVKTGVFDTEVLAGRK